MKRFWHQAEYATLPAAEPAAWQVLLDGRPLRVPGGKPLHLPSEQLAAAIAAEWQVAGGAQGGDMSYADVPLTRIAGTGQERIAANPEPVILELAQYGQSDLLCYRAATPPLLAERQHVMWQPWLDWADRRLGARLAVTTGVIHVPQDPRALAALAESMAAMHPLALAALGVIVPALGSLVLGLAVADAAIDAAEAERLSTLDERFQEEAWGADDQAVLRRSRVAEDVAAAARFLDLLRA